MNPLNFIQHLFTLRAIERELADEKIVSKALRAENDKLHAQLETQLQAQDTELQKRDAIITGLRQENKELNDLLHTRQIVETDFDPRKP